MLEKIAGVIAELDVLVGFSVAATNHANTYTKPRIKPEGEILSLVDSRHPLIEVLDPMSCISNDCRMVREKNNL